MREKFVELQQIVFPLLGLGSRGMIPQKSLKIIYARLATYTFHAISAVITLKLSVI